jgi:hypothetical protein
VARVAIEDAAGEERPYDEPAQWHALRLVHRAAKGGHQYDRHTLVEEHEERPQALRQREREGQRQRASEDGWSRRRARDPVFDRMRHATARPLSHWDESYNNEGIISRLDSFIQES